MNNKEKYEKICEKIERVFKNSSEKNAMIATVLGVSGMLCEYIHHKVPSSEIPLGVKYGMTLTAANLINVLLGEEISIVDYSQVEEEIISEQSQEIIYRKMKKILVDFHNELLKENFEMNKIYENLQ